MTMEFRNQMNCDREMIESRLADFFTGEGLEQAMRYSLMAGGKRIRPILAVEFCRAAGGGLEEALDFGCALEMVHTYSLIHDDLPCMDNDDLRRGMPTCHKKFDECIATLAGDALQSAAFRTILSVPGPWEQDPAAPGKAAKVLAEAAGELGMCAGQYWDTIGDGKPHTLEELSAIHDKKTGALLRAACIMGVLASAGHRQLDESCVESARTYATHLGMAFQIQDDLLDATSTTEELGKPVGSDEANSKTTYITLLGVQGCQEMVLEHTRLAKEALKKGKWLGSTDFLCWVADELAQRKN